MTAATQVALPGTAPRTNTKTLLEVLRRHYIKPSANPPGGIFIPECGINGSHIQSRADALYVGFTSTSGRLLVGHEIKVSRSDWRKELETAGKADFWADACHEWWIVAPGPEIVPADEIPQGWGLLYPGRAMRMKVVVKAATKPAQHLPPWDAVRSIMARLDTLQTQAMHAWTQEQHDATRREIDRRVEDRVAAAGRTTLTQEQGRKIDVVDRLEQVLGGNIDAWAFGEDALDPETVAAVLRMVRSIKSAGGKVFHEEHSVTRLRRGATAMLDGLAEYDAARTALAELIEARA